MVSRSARPLPVRDRVSAALTSVLGRVGFEPRAPTPPDLDPAFLELHRSCEAFTMTSIERMYALHQAVRYLGARRVPGDLVECGVYRGGSSMMAALTLLQTGDEERRLWLYDTFEGMSQPTAQDGPQARAEWARNQTDDVNLWCYGALDEVHANLLSTGVAPDRLSLVKGKVEDTIPQTVPQHIALLRLDTDWYESTRHELEHLFPLLQPGGVLIIDDYGHWEGARQAVDEYIAEHGLTLLLNRIDYTGRLAIKQA